MPPLPAGHMLPLHLHPPYPRGMNSYHMMLPHFPPALAPMHLPPPSPVTKRTRDSPVFDGTDGRGDHKPPLCEAGRHHPAAPQDGHHPLKKRRLGRWTELEEYYAQLLIVAFKAGIISIPEGMTLRSYVADQLKCDAMRVSKKFNGVFASGRSRETGYPGRCSGGVQSMLDQPVPWEDRDAILAKLYQAKEAFLTQSGGRTSLVVTGEGAAAEASEG